ncbi:phosphopantetheine-binding protein [Bacteroides thetaiotaomicron]|uniref:acyl carrier protein n=1 Tax=Bacteroides thetaiotaomicron TaxID=818 RepID=UPI0032C0B1E9
MEFNDVKKVVKKIVGEVVGIDEFNDLDSLTDDLGYDSIDFIQLRSNLSNEFFIDITPQTWFNFINDIQLNSKYAYDSEVISEWINKLAEYGINVTPELVETIQTLNEKNDRDSISARILSLINVNTISILLIKLQKQ